MGVKNLIKNLAGVSHVVNVYELSEKKVLVDTSVWIHNLISIHADDVFLSNHDSVVSAFMGRYKRLTDSGLVVHFVLDGEKNDFKSGTDAGRRQRRDAALDKIEEELSKESPDLTVVSKLKKQAVSVSSTLVKDIVNALESENVPYVVADEEADHELVNLYRERCYDYVLTVDSDLLVHSVRTILGINYHTGLGNMYDFSQPHIDWKSCALAAGIQRHGFERAIVAYSLIAGNDYLSVPGIGPGTAVKIVESLDVSNNLLRGLAEVLLDTKRFKKKNSDITCHDDVVGILNTAHEGFFKPIRVGNIID